MKLAVAGTIFVDIKGHPLEEFIPAGRNAGKVEEFHGGVGRNIAEDIVNYGEEAVLISLVDHSGSARAVLDHLKEVGVNTDYIRASERGMGIWLAVFDQTGEVYANISKRPELLEICTTLDESGEKAFADADAILVETDMEEEVLEMIFALADKLGKRVFTVISNMSIARERIPFIRKSDCFVCNRQEASMLFDDESAQNMSPSEMLLLLKEKTAEMGIRSMVVTMDKYGAVFASSETGESGICRAEKVNVRDTTGAGDAFFAGLSMGLAGGKSMAQACSIGTQMAARVIESQGNVYTG